ncbi:hypothetical protein GGX14DRAFT_378363 [Mycena pura]|uniref:Integrase core domain-containing protein n=1 Tax=Mycena pura TaxID=153505 RepID=A0AAD6UWJ5_9AGAR|nr:hypothetical protein GGX14DRAFT_378363 [Mycena pura]
MESVKGHGRGSYIWGSSVHNIRIERLWVDVTRGIGKKWADFFYDLEESHGLCVDRPAHLWLLHHLFLGPLNADMQEWADAWNSHKITIKGEKKASPREMFTFGLLEQGPRGIGPLIQAEEEAVEDLAQFGVDWEAQGNTDILAHHADNNPQEWQDDRGFGDFPTPANMSEVVVEAPNCPFSADECTALDNELAQLVDVTSRDMAVRRLVWKAALAICIQMNP